MRPPTTYFGRSRRGAVLVIVLLGLMLLVGTIFFVFNLGEQLNRRLDMQGASDAGTISGAVWMARSMNILAMNNVGQAKIISLAPVLDAMPLAAELAVLEMEANKGLAEGIKLQLQRGVPASRTETVIASDGSQYAFLREGLRELARQMATDNSQSTTQTHYDRLRNLDNVLNSDDEMSKESGAFDVAQLTHWNASGGRGQLWQAALTLRELSDATLASSGELAQTNAVRIGRVNGAASAFMIPLLPKIPARMGRFEDFFPVWLGRLTVRSDSATATMPIYGQVNRINQIDSRLRQISSRLNQIASELGGNISQSRRSRLENERNNLLTEVRNRDYQKEQIFTNLQNRCPGGSIPDMVYPYRLGPYARLMRWRHSLYHGWSPGTRHGGGSDPEIRQDHQREDGRSWRELKGYTAYGPYRWALDRIRWWFGEAGSRQWWRQQGVTSVARFPFYHRWAANIKFSYIFGVRQAQSVKYPTKWIADYNEAKAFVANPENQHKIIRTRWYRVRVVSSVSWEDATNWLRDATTYWSPDRIYLPNAHPPSHWIYERRGWYDIETYLSRPRIQLRGETAKLTNHVWQWKRSDQVRFDRRVGIKERRDANNRIILQDRFLITWYVFGGLQVGEEAVVANPLNWPSGETYLPAPVLIDTSEGDYDYNRDSGIQRKYFSYLGVAQCSNRSRAWPQRFRAGNPAGQIVAFTQGETFNNLSWGLWTQDWRAKLTPISQWERWTEQFTQSIENDSIPADLPGLDSETVNEIQNYMNRLNPNLADIFMNH